ncbi:hypothetical protein GE061_019418 [Apolygus lucorum]|uniref:Trichohyalin-plectin-homology domain-containing protein n=1 Tax=Apolygus lucorum TaxID=248454 RepID=A0A6A4JIT2_APOLU|nr:hypothetical protein GE061_019418 [Apolygus lucorum]
MGDPFVLLRNELLAARPSLKKYVAKNKLPPSPGESSYQRIVVRRRPRDRPIMDPERFTRVPPRNVNGEVDVFDHNGKKYKRVAYGTNNTFLVHRGLNPPNKYSKTICPDKMDDFERKKQSTMAARAAKALEAFVQKNILSEESEARRDALRNMASYKSGVVDDLVKQNRAKTALILKNSDRAMVDKQEEMRDFYGHVGSKQILAMRELQIEDHKHFKDVGIESGEIFFQKEPNEEDGEPSEYEEMVLKRVALKEKNMKIVDVLKKQALEREILKELEVEENLENALRLDALAEAELQKRLAEKEEDERERQRHFDTFNAIVAYRDYLRQVRVAEDDALWQREKDFLEEKEKFNQAFNEKQNKIKDERRRLVSAVRADLGSEMEKREQQDMEYYYTLQKERDIQMEDQEIQEKKDKKEAMEALMRDWGRITEANRLIKEMEQRRENEEKERMMKFLELENNAKKAEERKRLVDKDINRMEIMYQINERERKRQEENEAKAREIKLLRAEEFVREGKIKERRLERMEDFKNNGLPERFLSNIRKHYNL